MPAEIYTGSLPGDNDLWGLDCLQCWAVTGRCPFLRLELFVLWGRVDTPEAPQEKASVRHQFRFLASHQRAFIPRGCGYLWGGGVGLALVPPRLIVTIISGGVEGLTKQDLSNDVFQLQGTAAILSKVE